jgi:hypothetical protein
MTRGAKSMHTVSFIKRADKKPEDRTTRAKKVFGVLAIDRIFIPASIKKPERRRLATRIIIAKSKERVSVSMELKASRYPSPPESTTRTAEVKAIVERFIASLGNRPIAMPKNPAAITIYAKIGKSLMATDNVSQWGNMMKAS